MTSRTTPTTTTITTSHDPVMRRRAACAAALWAIATLAASCEPAPAAPVIDCSQVTAPSYAALTIWPLCTDCHSASKTGAARNKAPVGVDFDSYAAAKAQAASAAAQVNAGLMPERTDAQPSAEQKAALFAWAMCGTPN